MIIAKRPRGYASLRKLSSFSIKGTGAEPVEIRLPPRPETASDVHAGA